MMSEERPAMSTLLVGLDHGATADHKASGGDSVEESPLMKCAALMCTHGAVEIGIFDPSASPRMTFAWFLRCESGVAELTCDTEESRAVLSAGDTTRLDVETVGDDVRSPNREVVASQRRSILQREPGIRKVTFHRRLPAIDRDTYRRHFQQHQSIAAVHHATARRYRQSFVLNHGDDAEGRFDGISEHWYASLPQARKHHFSHPESGSVVNSDVVRWLDVARAISESAL
jgi:hypothetical protein